MNNPKMTSNNKLNNGYNIDVDPNTKTVSYNPSHEDNVDVWSIFKRKRGPRGDGNPLIYTPGWTFKSDNDRNTIEQQFESIANKFASMYPIGVTILMPSGNELNNHIAEIVMSQSKNV